jgi:pyruvate dehydrogenase E2 component (dihydrolipoamide acetyltransferase)
MAEELVMPRLSDTMERGTVARWLKREGDEVHAGDVVAEIETDKATMEYQSDLDGVLLRILVGDGEAAELGAPIGIVGARGEQVDGHAAVPPPAAETPPEAESESEPEPKPEPEPEPVGVSVPGRESPTTDVLRASPVARRMAEEAGVDIRTLAGKGSGPDGRIVRVDVERLLERGTPPAAPAAAPPQPAAAPAPATAPPPPAGESVEPSKMLKIIARRMAEAKATVPHFYLTSEIDMGRALEVRAEYNEALADQGVKVSVTDMIIKACGLALRDAPQFHRSWIDDRLVYHGAAHVGVAVALDDGLIVPVIRDVDTRPLRAVAEDLRDLASRARANQLKQREIEGATFTVSNLGMFGIARFAAIINPPEPGILAVGATVERPVVRDGAVVVRPIAEVTLSVDHRATSGADGARFLDSVKKYLERPLLLLG